MISKNLTATLLQALTGAVPPGALVAAIGAEMVEARIGAINECAKVCESKLSTEGEFPGSNGWIALDECLRDIRALALPHTPGEKATSS